MQLHSRPRGISFSVEKAWIKLGLRKSKGSRTERLEAGCRAVLCKQWRPSGLLILQRLLCWSVRFAVVSCTVTQELDCRSGRISWWRGGAA